MSVREGRQIGRLGEKRPNERVWLARIGAFDAHPASGDRRAGQPMFSRRSQAVVRRSGMQPRVVRLQNQRRFAVRRAFRSFGRRRPVRRATPTCIRLLPAASNVAATLTEAFRKPPVSKNKSTQSDRILCRSNWKPTEPAGRRCAERGRQSPAKTACQNGGNRWPIASPARVHTPATAVVPEFCKFLPSPFGRGAGGEGLAKTHKQERQFFVKRPSPWPSPKGRGDFRSHICRSPGGSTASSRTGRSSWCRTSGRA